MGKKANSVYGLLLAVTVLAAVAVSSVGESYARYENTTTWNTFVEPVVAEKAVSSDWLQEVSQPPVTILLGEMSGNEMQVTFALESTADVSGNLSWTVDQPQYLQVTSDTANPVQLVKDQNKTVTLTLSATETALTVVRDAVPVKVQVSWGDVMKGTFQVILPAVTAAEEAQTGEEIIPGDEVQTPTESASVGVSVPEHMDPAGILPVKLTVEAGVTRISLGLVREGQVELQLFPAGSRYSLDNGQSYFALYQPGLVELDAAAAEKVLYLDLSRMELAADKPLTLAAQAGGDGLLNSTAQASTIPDVSCVVTADNRVLSSGSAVQLALPAQWKDLALSYSIEQLVLQSSGQTEQKVYVPVTDLTTGALRARLVDGDSGDTLIIETGETLPAAGTYLVHLTWNFEGVGFAKTQTTFFVNYLAQTNTESVETGGAEQ